MASVGGSDGDGGGSRYEKDLAAAKLLAEKQQNNKNFDNSVSGGCMDSWLLKSIKWIFIIFVIYAILMLIFKLGSITINNVSNINTINDYGISLYLNNIISADRDAEFSVNSEPLNCYLEFDDALSGKGSPLRILKKGENFIYRGCNSEGTKTIIAIELISKKPSYCYTIIPENWSGNSFWGNNPSKFITEVTKERKE